MSGAGRSSTGSKNSAGPLSNAARQRRWRQKNKELLRKWRATLPTLRVTGTGPTRQAVTRNESPRLPVPVTEESIDDAITQLRQRGDQLTADYIKLLTTPGLTTVEARGIRSRFIKWRELFDASVAKSSHRRLPHQSQAKVKKTGGAR